MSFQTLKKTLLTSSLITKHGLRKQIEAAVVVEEAQKTLAKVCDDAVAERVRAHSVRAGILVYVTASSPAASEVRARAGEIVRHLEKVLGVTVVKTIIVRIS